MIDRCPEIYLTKIDKPIPKICKYIRASVGYVIKQIYGFNQPLGVVVIVRPFTLSRQYVG